MKKVIRKIAKQTLAFVSDQYLVIFFMLTLGIKLYFFSTYITKMMWSGQYTNSIICGYFSAAIIFLPLLFIRRYKNAVAILIAFLFSVLILIDIIYYANYSSLPTIGVLDTIGQTKDVMPAIGTLLNWWNLWYFVDVLLALALIKPAKILRNKVIKKYKLDKSDVRLAWIAAIFIIAGFWNSLLLSGPNKLTEVIDRGFDTVSTSQYYGLLVAHAVDIARFVDQETTHLSADEVKELSQWVKTNKPNQTSNELTGIAKGKNVIMIQVESMGGFVMNQNVNGKALMPNLDELASQSMFFPNNRFLYGAGHTSDTDFVANTSYFPMDDAAIFVRFGQDDFSSLPKALKNKNYSAYAYHGFNRNFWNRNVALRSLGYQKFYAADNYPKGEKLNMGLMDGEFLAKTAEYIKKQPKPSFSYVVTLTSHSPFWTNDKTKDLGLNRDEYPPQVAGYLENINYVDRMLGKFFDQLKSDKLFDDSLILVYGDHIPVLPKFKVGSIEYDPETVSSKEVPLIIKLPNKTDGQNFPKKGTHIDIMPTVLDLTGVKTNQLMFGQSLFAKGDKVLRVCENQFVSFDTKGDCKVMLQTQKLKSSEIIRYNQFNNILK